MGFFSLTGRRTPPEVSPGVGRGSPGSSDPEERDTSRTESVDSETVYSRRTSPGVEDQLPTPGVWVRESDLSENHYLCRPLSTRVVAQDPLVERYLGRVGPDIAPGLVHLHPSCLRTLDKEGI